LLAFYNDDLLSIDELLQPINGSDIKKYYDYDKITDRETFKE